MRLLPAALCVVCTALLALAVSFGSLTADDGFDAAVAAAETAFAKGIGSMVAEPEAARTDFSAAAEGYAAAMALRPSAALAYNEGNARLRAGQLGEAIAAYRSALLRAPGDTRAEHNLTEARRQLARSIAPPAPRWIDSARQAWTWLPARLPTALAAWGLGFALLATAVMGPGSRARWIDRAGAACVVTATLLGLTVAVDAIAMQHDDSGVLKASTVLRKGNGEGFSPELAEPLPAGTECRIGESRPGWIEVEISGPSRGWVREDAVIRVK